jgi:hypothetical protein
MFTDKDKLGKKKKDSKTKKNKPLLRDKLLDDSTKLKHDSGESDMIIPGEITKPEEIDESEKYVKKEKFSLSMFLAYVFSPISALIYMKMKDGMRESFHAKQALYMGIINFVLFFFLIGFFTWIYTIYIGFKAAKGEDLEVPYITKMVKGEN